MLAGKIFILNGSAPELTQQVAKALQDECKTPFLLCGRMLYAQQILGEPKPMPGQSLKALHAIISGLARNHCNVIVDHSIETREQYDELVLFLRGLDVTWVQVKTAIEINLCLGIKYQLQINPTVDDLNECARQAISFAKKNRSKTEPRAKWIPHLSPNVEYPYGNGIIVTGASYAHLLNVSRELQTQLQTPYCMYPINHLLNKCLPNEYNALNQDLPIKGNAKQGLFLVKTSNRDPAIWQLQIGNVARLALSGLYSAMVNMLMAGIHVISPQQYYYPDWYDEIAHSLFNQNIFWIYDPNNSHQLALEKLTAHQLYFDIGFDLELDHVQIDHEAIIAQIENQLKGDMR